VIQLIISFP
jgi:hypothetical protein